MSIFTAAVLHPVTQERALVGETTPVTWNNVTHHSESDHADSDCMPLLQGCHIL